MQEIFFLLPLRCNSKHFNFVAPATEMQCAAVFSDNQHECKEVIITVCQTSGFSTQLLSKAFYPKYNKKSVESLAKFSASFLLVTKSIEIVPAGGPPMFGLYVNEF